MLHPGVKPLRIYDQGFQNQVSYNEGLSTKGLTTRVLTTGNFMTRDLTIKKNYKHEYYNQGSYN